METWPDACASDQLSGKENSWLGVISTFLSPLKPCISLHKMPWDQVCQSKAIWRHLTGRRHWFFPGGRRFGGVVMPWQWEISSTLLSAIWGLCQKQVEEAYYSMWPLICEGMLTDIQSHLVDTPPFPYQVQCSLCNATCYQDRLDIKHSTQSA